MLKLLLFTFILSKNYIVMKFSVKLVSHWVIYCVDRNCKYRHNNLQAIFHIVLLISNCPYNNYRQAILAEKLLLSNMEYRRHTLIIASWGLFVARCRRRRKQIKAALKISLKYSTLKGAMTSSFCKALLKSALRKGQGPPPFVQENLLR